MENEKPGAVPPAKKEANMSTGVEVAGKVVAAVLRVLSIVVNAFFFVLSDRTAYASPRSLNFFSLSFFLSVRAVCVTIRMMDESLFLVRFSDLVLRRFFPDAQNLIVVLLLRLFQGEFRLVQQRPRI